MKRTEINSLIHWKKETRRKPLIIRGARQVGKTWLMKEFGKREYEQTIYINFESSKHLKNIFTNDFDIERIITALQIETGIIFNPQNTLIIFDEIQEAPEAITSLKYFYETVPEYHLISAGSLLGVALTKHTSFPVGKVEFLDLYPLSFTEFLEATGQRKLISLLKGKNWELIKTFKQKLIQFLKYYYFIGGMPEAVSAFSINNDFNEVRNIQKDILIAYEQDFSKHAPTNIVPRIRMVWNSIPAQLAKENRKFIYGLIKEGARAKNFELAINWLIDCGLIHKINRVTKPAFPLKAYVDFSAFKLFLVDIGLLAAMGNIDIKTLLEGNAVFEEFKGAITEQYVLQQMLCTKNFDIFYWSTERSNAEVDFLIQNKDEVIPVEVKAEENLQAKSLKVFCLKYSPATAIRTSMSDFREESWLINVPLYAIAELQNFSSSTMD
ncbi:MAG: ATP-binding protein [Bacteroidales bacterium]|nr:ATP-binding protein [Bacteroidales bacterium]